MLAAITRRKQLALVQKPLPRLRPGWALVRVRLAGICNTDIEILRGYHNFHGTLGHEFVGDVVRVASAKDKKWIGRRVVGEINVACAGARVSSKQTVQLLPPRNSNALRAPPRTWNNGP